MEMRAIFLLLQVISMSQIITSSDMTVPERNTGSETEKNSYPDPVVSNSILSSKFCNISGGSTSREKRQKRDFKWDNEKREELVNIYLKTYPYNGSHPVGISDEWAGRHPESPRFNNSYLADRARRYLEKHPSHSEERPSKRLFEWTHRRDSDLYHIYHVTLPEGKRQPVYMHKIWTDFHPDLKDLTHDQMMERVNYLRKNPPNRDFPWTSEQNQELLRIYHNTDPGLKDQGQRIYDIWSKIHPRFKFMTPYYLQVHASTLANHVHSAGGRNKYSKLTDEQNAYLFDMYRRLTKPRKPLYDFHKAWVREYPSFAYLTPKRISSHVQRWASKHGFPSEEMAEVGEHSEFRQLKSRKNHKYTPEEKAELLATYQQTHPQKPGHGNRIRAEWIKKHKNVNDVQGKSLKAMIRQWMQDTTDKRGKAPMVTPKTEVELESSSGASDMQ